MEREIRDRVSFIESDRGEYRNPRGDDANTRRSKDGSSATKNHIHHFGYKVHTLVNEIKIIEKLSVTPANAHDLQIDLSIFGIICYRNKGYFGSECKGINGTVDRSVRGHPLWSCNGNDGSESKGEDILHCNMLQPCKGKIY